MPLSQPVMNKPLPSHLFVSDRGDLHDTRDPKWAATKPLRERYIGQAPMINSVRDFKAALRAGQYTSLGGYPCYFVTSDGAALSFESAAKSTACIMRSIATNANDGWRVVAVYVNWEDGELYCEDSGKRIPSAYAEPE